MEELILREADIDDVLLLTQLRFTYLREDRGSLTEDEEAALNKSLPDYFRRNIGTMFFAYIAEVNGKAVSTAYLAISEKPANPAFITGKIGTILNVYTHPAYRRKGYAQCPVPDAVRRRTCFRAQAPYPCGYSGGSLQAGGGSSLQGPYPGPRSPDV